MKAPAFQFYARDFLVSTLGWPAEDRGIYITLLSLQWDRDGLPVNEDELCALAGVRRSIPARVLNKFPIADDGFRRNLRLEKEREKQRAFSKSRSTNAGKRWQSKSNASASHTQSMADALQSASASADNPLNPPQAGDGEAGEGEVKTRRTGADRAVDRVVAGGINDTF